MVNVTDSAICSCPSSPFCACSPPAPLSHSRPPLSHASLPFARPLTRPLAARRLSHHFIEIHTPRLLCGSHMAQHNRPTGRTRTHTRVHARRLLSQLTNACVSLAHRLPPHLHAVRHKHVHTPVQGERVHGVYHHAHYHVVCRGASRPWRGHDGEPCLLR